MNSLINWLFRQDEDSVIEEATITGLNKKIHNCDRFGKAITQHVMQLTKEQRIVADRLIPALFELGIGSHPPRDLSRFMKTVHWPRHDQASRQMLNEWWHILQHCASLHHRPYNDHSTDCCPVNQHNLHAARGIIWLQIHLRGAKIVPVLLPFMANCMQQYPQCSEIAEQLALSAANMLVRQPFYRFHRHDIAIRYPILSRGRMGRRLELHQRRWAS